MVRRRFDREFGGTVGHHFDPEIARNDLGELSRTADHIKTFVDQHLAHSDARASASDLPTFEELDVRSNSWVACMRSTPNS